MRPGKTRATTPRLRFALLGLGPLAALAMTSCGGSKAANTLTLYSGQHEQTTALLVKAFERQTGIKVQVRSADEATLANQILQEGSSSPADVFYAENTPALETLGERGLLAPVQASTLEAVPRSSHSPRGDWVGVSARVAELVYDPSEIPSAQVPSAILELGEPRFSSKVGFAPSETDFQPLVTSIVRHDGRPAAERWLKALQQHAHVYPDNETVVSQVNNGQAALGPINHYYWYRLRREQGEGGTHSRLHPYAKGDAGNLIVVSGAAVLRSSNRQADAQKLLAFLVSEAGQRTLASSDSYEYPLRPGVAPPAGLPPLSSFGASALTPAQLGDGHEALEIEQHLGLL
ncbi:MAG TPA: extracellular solute-binding protein [Solirubrobacteraceae bacterium]|jgi:iron(III) transport system substrate-binding protein|nr:extracellular solute-binding protein [Solirubrobacteraceae bacterium]